MKRMHQSATDMIQETTANYAMIKCKGFYIGWFSQSSADSLLLQVPWSWQLFGFNTGAMRFLLFRVLQRVKWLWSTRIEKRGTVDCVMIDDWCQTKGVHFGLLHLSCVLDVVARSLLLGTLLVALYWMHASPGVKYRTAGQELFWAKDLHFWVVGKESLVSWCVLYSPHVAAMRQHAHDHRNGNLAAP